MAVYQSPKKPTGRNLLIHGIVVIAILAIIHSQFYGKSLSYSLHFSKRFTNARFTTGSIEYGTLQNCEFHSCWFEEATFYASGIKDVDFDHSFWSPANLTATRRCNFTRTRFHNVQFRGAEFSMCNFDHVDFAGSDLSSVRFDECRFVACSFVGAALTNTRFANSNNGFLDGSQYDYQTVFPKGYDPKQHGLVNNPSIEEPPANKKIEQGRK